MAEDGAGWTRTTDFEQLVETESRGLLAAVYAIVGDRHRSEEIVQEAFERGYRRWRRVSRLDRPGAWVRRVALNEAISTTRRRATEQRALAPSRWPRRSSGGAPTRSPPSTTRGCGPRCDGSPSEQAAVIALRYGADLGIDDIAETMHLTVPAVKSLLHRARASLRGSTELQPYAE